MSLDVENNKQDDEDISQPASPQDASQSPELAKPEDPPHVQTRSKKTKDLSRLGVGRPAVAGGSGARSVTKASTPSKRITRSSGTLKRVSHAPEEDIPFINEDSPEPVSSTSQSPSHDQDRENTPIPTETIPNDIEGYINAAVSLFLPLLLLRAPVLLGSKVQPLKAQIERLGVEVAALRASQAELKSLRSQQSELKHKVQDLSLQLNQYRRASSRSSDKGKTPIHSLTLYVAVFC
jgi:outer membrane murein-binding lipoprotein Lpp